MVTQETTYYNDFTIKTFTELTDGVITTYEQYNTNGQKISSVKGELTEKWEYSRNRLRRYCNNKGDWERYTYKGNDIFLLANKNGMTTKFNYHKGEICLNLPHGKRNLWRHRK